MLSGIISGVVIKLVEKLFDHAMTQRDTDKIIQHEQNIMLVNRARLTSTDELVLSHIERHAPLTFEQLDKAFSKVTCLAKRVELFGAHGFTEMDNGIINITDKYSPLASDISKSSVDQTIIVSKDDTQSRGLK